MQRLGRGMAGVALGLAAAYGLVDVYQPTVVVGGSMAPTLPHGRLLFVDRTYYRNRVPRTGEVVVFRQGGETCIKRVYRGPGETVYCLEANVRGETVPLLLGARHAEKAPQRFLRGTRQHLRLVRLRVPDDRVFLVGDNPGRSEDSRHYGAVPIRNVIGRARVTPDLARVQAMEIRPSGVPRRVAQAGQTPG